MGVFLPGARGPWQAAIRWHSDPGTTQECAVPPQGLLAFESTRNGNKDLYLTRADGSGLRRVTRAETPEAEPAWSPDGEQLAYQSQRPYWQLFVAEWDGSRERRVRANLAWSPAWAPTGDWIAFGNLQGIHQVGASGEGERTLVSGGGTGRPSWSPDGRRLLFHSGRTGDVELYILDVDAAATKRLTDSPGQDFQGRWSPLGRRVAFASERDGDQEIFLLDLSSGHLRQLTDNDAEDMMPAWSPDGHWLAFVSDRDAGDREIYLMRADGSCQTRLTYNPGEDQYPAWRPSPGG